MGVYIADMEMPKNGETITITICDDGIVFEEWKEPGIVFKAIHVPPHGRLIDADALIDDVRKHSESYFADDFAHEWVDKAPTIIPAEEKTT